MSQQQVNELIKKGMRAAKRGKNETAVSLFSQALAKDPTNEMGWLWLARTVEDPAKKQDALNYVLRLNPDNQWARDELQKMGDVSSSSETTTGASTLQDQTSELELQAINCPNCLSSLPLRAGEATLTIGCEYCGSTVDLTKQYPAIVGNTSPKIRPSQPIELGDTATFNGVRYQVIGWFKVKGFDDEDAWFWEEWLLASETGTFKWLSYYHADGFSLQTKKPITEKINPKQARSLNIDGKKYPFTERARARIVALRGELTWQAQVGDRFEYAEGKRGSHRYGLEYGESYIEQYTGTHIPTLELWKAFNKPEIVQKLEAKAESNRTWNYSAAIFAVFYVIAVLVGNILSAGEGDVMVNQQVAVIPNQPRQQVGPFEIDDTRRPYRVSMQVQGVPLNQTADLAVQIVDDRENVYALKRANSSVTGPSIGSPRDNYYFNTDNTGNHYAIVTLQDQSTQMPTLSVNLNVTKGGLSGFWLGLFRTVCVLLAIVCLAVGQMDRLNKQLAS